MTHELGKFHAERTIEWLKTGEHGKVNSLCIYLEWKMEVGGQPGRGRSPAIVHTIANLEAMHLYHHNEEEGGLQSTTEPG
jgi:hypothetical protein